MQLGCFKKERFKTKCNSTICLVLSDSSIFPSYYQDTAHSILLIF